MNKQELEPIQICKDDAYSTGGSWEEISRICRSCDIMDKYVIGFYNFEDCYKMPECLKFVCVDWKSLKVLVYREPNVLVYSFEDYNQMLKALEFNEPLFIKEGMKQHFDDEYKRLFLFKNLDKKGLDVLKHGDTEIKPGDFLNTCWGYDQTNVELYVIKKILGKNYFIIQRVMGCVEESSLMYDDIRVSDTIEKIDVPEKAYISNDGYMSVCEHGYKRGLHKTDMNKTHYRTNSQFGH